MGVYGVGLAGIAVFYAAVLFVGLWAGTRQRGTSEEEVLLAGRRLGLLVGVLTLIATWVGGGYVNGTAEAMYSGGILWCQVPIGYSLSLLFGAILFVGPMRTQGCVTMLDPLQERFGPTVGGILFLPALCGDLFWCAAVLNALGSSLVVILGLPVELSIILSALFAAVYTVAGGLYSVSYTDVLQLLCIVIGLTLSVPFAMTHPAVRTSRLPMSSLLGSVESLDAARWLDGILLLTFGGIPWQGYFQRILSLKSASAAHTLSVLSMIGCIILALPAMAVGVIAKATDWGSVPGMNRSLNSDDRSVVLPLVLRYLTPPCIGGAAVFDLSISNVPRILMPTFTEICVTWLDMFLCTNLLLGLGEHCIFSRSLAISKIFASKNYEIAKSRYTGSSAGAGWTDSLVHTGQNGPVVWNGSTFAGWVSFFGLGAVSAAVMSSADSSILASSSMFTRNIYRMTLRPQASDRELLWVLRISVLVVSGLSAAIALTVSSIYYLSYLCSDLVYVLLFPQLLLAVRCPKHVNTYGSLASFSVGLSLRLLGGEPGLGLPVLLRYPLFDTVTGEQRFPHRTTAMLVALTVHLLASASASKFLGRGGVAEHWDVLKVFGTPKDTQRGVPLEDAPLDSRSALDLDLQTDFRT